MSGNNRVSYNFIYAGNFERILKICNKKEEIVSDKCIIGTCFCSIINDKDKVIALKQEFNEKYINKYTNKINLLGIKEIIDLIYTKLVNINKYFVILYNIFNKLSRESQMTNRLDKLEKHYNYYMKDIIILLDNIINTITSFEDMTYKCLSFKNIKIPFCSMTLISSDSRKYKYLYKINTLNDLLSVSFYTLCIHKHLLKHCQYCGKLFIPLNNRTKFCNNSCPTYPSLTCYQARTKRKIGDSLHEEDWQKKLNELERDRKNSIQFFSDNIAKTQNTRKREMLERNKKIFAEAATDLHLLISRSKNDDKYKYLKIYENLINNVRKNQKDTPPKFKVIQPKYKK